MSDYTQLTARELRLKWAEIIGRPMPPIGRSLIIKYLLWYGQAKREKISPLRFFHEVAQAAKGAERYYGRALSYYAMEQYPNAIMDCEYAVRGSTMERYYALLGLCYEMVNDYAKAEQVYTAGIMSEDEGFYRIIDPSGKVRRVDKLTSTGARLLKNRALLYQHKGEYRRALADYEQIRVGPYRDRRAIERAGCMQILLKNYEAALYDLSLAFDNNAFPEEIMNGDFLLPTVRRTCAEEKLYIKCYSELLAQRQGELTPKQQAYIYALRARIKWYLAGLGFGTAQEALDDYNSAIAQEPFNGKYYELVAEISFWADKYSQVIELGTKALRLNYESGLLYSRLVKVYKSIKEPQKAAAMKEKWNALVKRGR